MSTKDHVYQNFAFFFNIAYKTLVKHSSKVVGSKIFLQRTKFVLIFNLLIYGGRLCQVSTLQGVPQLPLALNTTLTCEMRSGTFSPKEILVI